MIKDAARRSSDNVNNILKCSAVVLRMTCTFFSNEDSTFSFSFDDTFTCPLLIPRVSFSVCYCFCYIRSSKRWHLLQLPRWRYSKEHILVNDVTQKTEVFFSSNRYQHDIQLISMITSLLLDPVLSFICLFTLVSPTPSRLPCLKIVTPMNQSFICRVVLDVFTSTHYRRHTHPLGSNDSPVFLTDSADVIRSSSFFCISTPFARRLQLQSCLLVLIFLIFSNIWSLSSSTFCRTQTPVVARVEIDLLDHLDQSILLFVYEKIERRTSRAPFMDVTRPLHREVTSIFPVILGRILSRHGILVHEAMELIFSFNFSGNAVLCLIFISRYHSVNFFTSSLNGLRHSILLRTSV